MNSVCLSLWMRVYNQVTTTMHAAYFAGVQAETFEETLIPRGQHNESHGR